MYKMQLAATVYIVYCSLLLASLFSSIFGVPAWNSEKQLANKRRKWRSTYKVDDDLQDRWGVVVPICTEDEYYDVNVQACSRCSDVCRPNIDLTFCASKCHEYFRIHLDSPTHPELHSSFVVTVISSSDDASEQRITEKPLFWTSVVSMTIAVAATVAIIVLCVRRRKPRTSLVERREANEECRARTLSETSDDREPEQRTLLYMNGRSPQTTSCRNEGREFQESNNRTMYMTAGEGYTTDRFGSAVSNQNGHCNIPSMPSPDRNWRQTSEQDSQLRSSPSLSLSGFAEDKRQLILPDSRLSSSSSSTSVTGYPEETAYTSSMHDTSIKSRETKRLSGFEENEETSVKENTLIDLNDPLLPRKSDSTLEPKAMGILMSNGDLTDIRQLQVSIRTMTDNDNDNNRSQCPKTRRTLYYSSSDCDDGVATGEFTDEPN